MTSMIGRLSAFAAALTFAAGAFAADPAPITHSFLATGSSTYILEVKPGADGAAAEPKVVWRYPGSTRDGWVLPSGNILLAVSKGGAFRGGGVLEVTRDGKTVFEYQGAQDEVNSVQKTAEGNYVITEAGPKPRLLEIKPDGTIAVEFPLQCQSGNAHMQTRMARKLADGTYLAPHLLDFAIKQYSAKGEVMKVIDTAADPKRSLHTWPFTAIRLPNGNTLAGLTNGNRVAEFDPEGKIVWQITNEELPADAQLRDPCGVQRLPNGNTVITSYGSGTNTKLIEVTPDKKVVWSYRDGQRQGIHHFQILDTNGVPLEGVPLK